MRTEIPKDGPSTVVFSIEDLNFFEMLDLLPQAKWIDIATFNISKKDIELHRILATKCPGIPVRFITKMPNWFESYRSPYFRKTFKDQFDLYHQRLDPTKYKCKFFGYFNVHNHSKLIITNDAAYVWW